MKRFVAAIAAFAPLLATGAYAQTVTEEVNKQLWCGTAFVVYLDGATDLDPDTQRILSGAQDLLAAATEAHLAAGFTAEQTDKIKADLVVAINQQFTDGTAQYEPEDCLTLLPPPAELEAPADGASSEPAADAASSEPMSEAPAMDAPSSAAP